MDAAQLDWNEGGQPTWHASRRSPSPEAAPIPVAEAPARLRVNWPAAGIVATFHGLLLFGLIAFDVVPLPTVKAPPTVVTLLQLPTDPPPVTAPPEASVEPVNVIAPEVVAPPPLVRTPLLAPPPIASAPTPPPVRVAVVAPSAPPAPPAPTGPVSAPDLATTMISATPPKYPIESRRKREQGTVVLNVLVSTVGSVETVAVARSSGFDRLDNAALNAVRRWRWSPLVRDGTALMVRGIVEIPFVLQG